MASTVESSLTTPTAPTLEDVNSASTSSSTADPSKAQASTVGSEVPKSESASGEKNGAPKPKVNLDDDGEEKKHDSMFECNICLDTAKNAVISMCGHLFCWSCIHQWMNGYQNTCPVCKSSISKEKVIPLYGRGGSNEDPRKTVPPRPAGQRTEPEQPQGFRRFTGDGGIHVSFGIGAFPFGFFTSSLNIGDMRGNIPQHSDEDRFLSKIFLYVALIFMAWLVLA